MASASSLVALALWEPLQLGQSLSLVPRLRILLSFIRSDLSVKPIDEWQLKESLTSFIKDALSVSVSDKDLSVHKEKDFHKKRRDEPVAFGSLLIWNLQDVGLDGWNDVDDASKSGETRLPKRTLVVVEKLTGVELNIGGLKLRCQARMEDADDFESMKRSWQAIYGPVQTDRMQNTPNTLIIQGIPSRWLAEPRVSSKASILVTHTIFSQFGAIRNLDIREDDLGSLAQGFGIGISSAFTCHLWIQYELYTGFCNAMRALCGRSMVRQGSSFNANYELSWDKDGYFSEANIRKRKFEREKAEEQQRRQLVMEARQAEIALRQAELARLEQENREREQKQQLREEEEKQKLERDSAKAKEELLSQHNINCMMEEEIIRKKQEQVGIENEKRQKQFQKCEDPWRREALRINRHNEVLLEARQRSKQIRQLEEENQRKLQSEEDVARLNNFRRSEEMQLRTQENISKEEQWRNLRYGHSVTSGQDPKDKGLRSQELDRWVLDDTSLTSVRHVETLERDRTKDIDHALLHSTKRIRSIVVDSRNLHLAAGSSNE